MNGWRLTGILSLLLCAMTLGLAASHAWDVEGVRLGVASRYAGVNANIIVPGDRVDGPSATHAVNGFPVTVEPA